MGKKLLLITIVAFFTSFLYASDLELGLSYTPGDVLKTDEAKQMESVTGRKQNDGILGFHAGYSFWWLFYVSSDSLVIPPWFVQQLSTYDKANGEFHQGIMAPGFITFVDFGIRPKFKHLYLLATIGINNLYIHSEYDDGEDTPMGVNMRLGAGWLFENLSIVFTTTSVFSNFNNLEDTVRGLVDQEPRATDDFLQSLIPSVGIVLHIK